MRDAFVKWCLFEHRDCNNDTLWVAFQAGWRFREQAIKRDHRGSGPDGSIMDLLSGTLEAS